jgi:hypothetical protein
VYRKALTTFVVAQGSLRRSTSASAADADVVFDFSLKECRCSVKIIQSCSAAHNYRIIIACV